jgi:DNA-binding MarR family transcriptional regulator
MISQPGFLPPETSQPEEQLAHLLPALWRTLVRATKATQDTGSLDSQMAVLRTLMSYGPLSPAVLAEELHLARPTVSNLLKALTAEHLVERQPSAEDGRSVMISLTPLGRGALEEFRHERTAVIESVLAVLSKGDREAIVHAIPALREMFHQFEGLAH